MAKDTRDGTPPTAAGRAGEASSVGLVSLVGAGPGHPDLLTRRAWKRLQTADIVLHDTLTGDEILAELPETVTIINVGKHPPDRTSQAEIHELMYDHARQGDDVVRLKGGDPNVFGRGGEEAEYLAAEGISFEVVPGVSSVLAAGSVSGIPLTHRDCSSSLTIITGHQTPEKENSAIDWPAIADMLETGGTLVILMGVSRLSQNVTALRDHGVSPELSVAMVEKATWSGQQVVVSTLDSIQNHAAEADIDSPAVTIVGEVVTTREAVVEQFRPWTEMSQPGWV